MTKSLSTSLTRFIPMAISYMGSGSALLASSVAQLLTFAILARFLGVAQFGTYAVITAIINVGVQLCGLGAQESLIRRVAQAPESYPRLIGHAAILSVISGAVLFVIGMIVLPLAAPASEDLATTLVTSALLLFSNLFLLKAISLSTQAFIAHSRFGAANRLDVIFAFVRTTAAVLGCMVFGVSSVAEWAWWFFGAHFVMAGFAIWQVGPLGLPKLTILKEEIRIGFLFSTQFVFRAIRGNADLLILGTVAGAEILGSYSVARRILESSFLSIEALNRLIYPGSAAKAANGIHNAWQRTRKVAVAAVGISIASAMAIFIIAPFLPLLFGDEYVSLVWLTRVLCWVVVPMGAYAAALEVLGAAGLQGSRAAILNSGNLVGSAIVALATYTFGIFGTLTSYYLVEIAVGIASWWVLAHHVSVHRARSLSL